MYGIKTAIIFFGIYTMDKQGNVAMTHYDFLYFSNGKKNIQQYQDNIVSFLKQNKRDEKIILGRINPVIVTKPDLFFHKDGILTIEKIEKNETKTQEEHFMRIKKDNVPFWMTYLFIDNQHDLVGGVRVFNSLLKYTKPANNWKKYFSHIAILRLYGTMYHKKYFPNFSEVPTDEYRITDEQGGNPMPLLKYDKGHLIHVSPDTQHHYLVKKEESKTTFKYDDENTFTMESPYINEIITSFGDTSHLADNEWLEYNKINIVKGLDNNSTLSGMSGIWGSLKKNQLANDNKYNSQINQGISDADLKNNKLTYFYESWKSHLQSPKDHIRIVVDSSKKGKLIHRFTGGDEPGNENFVGAQSAMADASIYSAEEIPRTISALNELVTEEQFENPFIYPLFCLPKTNKSKGGWIFIEVKKKLITNRDIAHSKKMNSMFDDLQASNSSQPESKSNTSENLFNSIMKDTHKKYITDSKSFSKKSSNEKKKDNNQDDNEDGDTVDIAYNSENFSISINQLDYPLYAHSMTFHYFKGNNSVEECYNLLKEKKEHYQATILQTKKTPGVASLFKLLVQIGLVIPEGTSNDSILSMFSMDKRIAPLTDTQCKLIFQLKLILGAFVNISMEEKIFTNLESWIDVVDEIEHQNKGLPKDKQDNWIAQKIIDFEKYPEGLIDTVALAIKTTGDIQRATDAVFERAYLVTFDSFLKDMVYYGFRCKCIYDPGKNIIEIFDTTRGDGGGFVSNVDEGGDDDNNGETKEEKKNEAAVVAVNKENIKILLNNVFPDGKFLEREGYDFPNLELSDVSTTEWNSQKNENYWVFETTDSEDEKYLFPQHILFLQLYGFILLTIYLKIKNENLKLVSTRKQTRTINLLTSTKHSSNSTDIFVNNFEAAYKILIKSLPNSSGQTVLLTTEPRIRRIYLAYSSFINSILGTSYNIRYPEKEPLHYKNDEVASSSDKDLINLHSRVLDLLSTLNKRCPPFLQESGFKNYQIKGILYSESPVSFKDFTTKYFNLIKDEILELLSEDKKEKGKSNHEPETNIGNKGMDDGVVKGPVDGVVKGMDKGVVDGVVKGLADGVDERVVDGVVEGKGVVIEGIDMDILWENFTTKEKRKWDTKNRGKQITPQEYDPYFYFQTNTQTKLVCFSKKVDKDIYSFFKLDEEDIQKNYSVRKLIHFRNWTTEARKKFVEDAIQMLENGHKVEIVKKMIKNISPNFWRHDKKNIEFRLDYLIENVPKPFITYLRQYTKIQSKTFFVGGGGEDDIDKLKEKIRQRCTKIDKNILNKLIEKKETIQNSDEIKKKNMDSNSGEQKSHSRKQTDVKGEKKNFNKEIFNFLKNDNSIKIEKFLNDIIDELNLLMEKINELPMKDINEERVSIDQLIKSIIKLSIPINPKHDIQFKLNNFLFVFDKLDQYLSISNISPESNNEKLAKESIKQTKIFLSSSDLIEISKKVSEDNEILISLKTKGYIDINNEGEIDFVMEFLYPNLLTKLSPIEIGMPKNKKRVSNIEGKNLEDNSKEKINQRRFRLLAHLQNWLSYKLTDQIKEDLDNRKTNNKTQYTDGKDYIGVSPKIWLKYAKRSDQEIRTTNLLTSLLTKTNANEILNGLLPGNLKSKKGGKKRNTIKRKRKHKYFSKRHNKNFNKKGTKKIKRKKRNTRKKY